ncbi:hypothetical protein [Phycicoccus duodecadis]|uniref:hypothetical protein n=1 Tax=Phycicoccus duodecadis TaxID=173053 RepID=UPI00117C28D2|nr:hypothetical protein [Phycicoccus duodecadis]
MAATGRQIQLTQANFPFYMYRDFPMHPGYLDLITTWDGQYYDAIATEGYATSAGLDPQGRSPAWAFPPGFPVAARALMGVTHWSFPLASTVLNVVLAGVAMVVLYDLVRRSAERFVAVAVVATTSFFVSAPLLQTSYSESAALLLLVLVLRAISDRHWGRAAVWVTALMFTRIITPPLAAVAVGCLVWRWRAGGSVSRGEAVRAALFAGVAVFGGFAWPLVVGRLQPDNPGALRASAAVNQSVSWLVQAYANAGVVALLLVTLGAGILLLAPWTSIGRAMGPELVIWSCTYCAMLLQVTPIQPGMLRYLLLAPGLLLPVLGPVRHQMRGRWVALGLLVVGLALAQWWFVDSLVRVGTTTQRFGP